MIARRVSQGQALPRLLNLGALRFGTDENQPFTPHRTQALRVCGDLRGIVGFKAIVDFCNDRLGPSPYFSP